MEIDIARLKELIDKREKLDKEIQEVAGGKKRIQTCSKCGGEHSARWCTGRDKLKENVTMNT